MRLAHGLVPLILISTLLLAGCITVDDNPVANCTSNSSAPATNGDQPATATPSPAPSLSNGSSPNLPSSAAAGPATNSSAPSPKKEGTDVPPGPLSAEPEPRGATTSPAGSNPPAASSPKPAAPTARAPPSQADTEPSTAESDDPGSDGPPETGEETDETPAPNNPRDVFRSPSVTAYTTADMTDPSPSSPRETNPQGNSKTSSKAQSRPQENPKTSDPSTTDSESRLRQGIMGDNAGSDSESPTSSKTTAVAAKNGSPLERKNIFVYPIKRAKEGEFITFPHLKAEDADGDPITYTFMPPLNSQGEWQTKRGDAGIYLTNITASDKKNTTTVTVILRIESANHPPTLHPISPIHVDEGQTVTIDPKTSDPDGDPVSITYSGWKTSFPYTTTPSDAGHHAVTVKASDGLNHATREVNITVTHANHPPEIKTAGDITTTEGEFIQVKPSVSDPDGDAFTLTFSKPLNSQGIWQTKVGDVGAYPTTITASDGQSTGRQSFVITITKKQFPPTFSGVEDITAREGDNIHLGITAKGPDGKELPVMYSGWMNGPTKEIGYSDSGKHEVTVTAGGAAGDGTAKATATFTITVIDVNRPPVFLPGAFK